MRHSVIISPHERTGIIVLATEASKEVGKIYAIGHKEDQMTELQHDLDQIAQRAFAKWLLGL